MRYDHFSMLPEMAFRKSAGGTIKPQSGGSSGGSSQPTQTNVTQTNIPQYAQPYVESMLGATQQQLFNTNQTGVGGYDANGNPLANGGYDAQGNAQPGTTEITGVKPYQPYSTNAADYFAGFSPLQQQAFNNIQNMQVSGQIGQGTDIANQASQGAMGTANPAMGYGGLGAQAGMSYGQNAQNPNAVQSYMNPYLQASLAPQQQLLNQQFGIQNAANQAQATQQGAFGGGRQAIMQGLNQQNQDLATNQLISQGYNQAYNTAQQNMQQAAALGMQGAGLGLQGVQGAQNAYNLGLQGANTLNTLGNSQYNQQMGIDQAQLQAGGLQQQQQQNIINQAVQNYAMAQQYPQQQLSFMNSMLRGLPMQSTTTQQYQAAPSLASTATGLGLGAYGISKMAKGGKVKAMATGGISSGVPEGKLDAMLGRLSDQQLVQKANPKANDPQTAEAAQSQIDFRENMRNPGVAAAPAGNTQFLAGGGIVAFGAGGETELDDSYISGGDAPQVKKEEPKISPTSTNTDLASIMAQKRAILGEDTSGKGLLEYLERRQAEGAGDKEKQSAMRFLQAGLGILGGTSPYGAVNIGKGSEAAVQGAMQDAQEQRKEEMAMAKARFDVERTRYTDNAKLLEEASKDYQGLLDRASKEGISKNEIDSRIQVAKMEIGAANARAQAGYTHAEGMENIRAENAKALALQNKQDDPFHIAYNNALGVLTNGNPEKATWEQKQTASTAANLQTHPNVGVSQQKEFSLEASKDPKIQKLTMQLMGTDNEQDQKSILDKISARKKEISSGQDQKTGQFNFVNGKLVPVNQ